MIPQGPEHDLPGTALPPSAPRSLRQRGYELLFLSNTPQARRFDVIVSVLIVISILSVILESVPEYEAAAGPLFTTLEWLITVAFTIEYALRVYCSPLRRRYVLSFFGLVDLLSTLPLYIGLLFPVASSVVVVRGLRLLRLFRMFGRGTWAERGGLVLAAIRASLPKIAVFISGVVVMTVILGTAIFLIEGPDGQFRSIPQGMYWAVTTLTTVGYGDVVPLTGGGRTLAAIVMVLGYGVIAVPVGIVSSEIAQAVDAYRRRRSCPSCLTTGHAIDSRFCRFCGSTLPESEPLSPTGRLTVASSPRVPLTAQAGADDRS